MSRYKHTMQADVGVDDEYLVNLHSLDCLGMMETSSRETHPSLTST